MLGRGGMGADEQWVQGSRNPPYNIMPPVNNTGLHAGRFVKVVHRMSSVLTTIRKELNVEKDRRKMKILNLKW